MKFKAICTDIDGTLLDSRRELSDFTIQSFRALQGKVPVILASSRMPSAMRHLQEQLGVLEHPLICFNGGYVIHERANLQPEVLHSTFISVDVCEGILELAEGTSIHTSLYFEDGWYAPQWDQWAEREARITKVRPEIKNSFEVIQEWSRSNRGGHKVMCMGPEEQINTMEQKLQDQFGRDIHIYRSRPTYLELATKAISKGAALKLLLDQKFQFSHQDVIAFGDNYNDVDLLEIAGHGVAVANAREEVKRVANEITGDSKEDGVALVVQKYFLEE